MRIELLTKNTGWYGSHSGYYERIPEQVCRLQPTTRVTRPLLNWGSRALGKVIAKGRGAPERNQSITFAEEVFYWRISGQDRVGHMLCTEDNSFLLKRWAKAPRSLLGTLHYPPELLTADMTDSIRRLSSAVLLYRKDVEFFETLVGVGRVVFIPHGVDLDFFRPAAAALSELPPRFAYVGQFGRDTEMFARVVPRLLERHPTVEFDVVVARLDFADRHLKKLQGIPRVHFHAGVPDETLLQIYQRARALLLPIKASGANNAIVEAISCGLPVITTDVGGIRDYGGGTLFPIVAAGDDDALFDFAMDHLTQPQKFLVQREALRAFAVTHLGWAETARQHIAACRRLGERG